MMNAITALYSPGRYRTPYAGGQAVSFTADKVTAIGRISTYGDNVIRYMVRIEGSDEIYFVKPALIGHRDALGRLRKSSTRLWHAIYNNRVYRLSDEQVTHFRQPEK
jgi:hypothetical protein